MNVKFLTVGSRGKKKSNPVKFSTVRDLPSEECERLLEKFVPSSIRRTKISQQLFLKYEILCLCVCMGICSPFIVIPGSVFY